ncbi:MAG TPA: response regulator [Flavobacterium sp.]|jgi:CheY-like chemotaxis protein
MIPNSPAVKIILTDDDADDRSIFKDAFDELSIQNDLTLFSNGDELMDYLHSDEIDLPQILFLDLNMPRKNGLQCLREIRCDKRLRDLHVAIYSTSSSESEIAKTFAGGADLYIRKPSEFSKLKKIISEVVASNFDNYRKHGRDRYIFSI